MPAPTPDSLTSLGDVKTTLGIASANTAQDALLNLLIPQVSAVIQKSLKRPFVLASNAANPVTEYYSGPGDEWLILRNWPVQAPVLTGNATLNNSTLSGLGSTSYLFPGQSVVGPGVPTGTTVLSVGSGQVSLSNPATASVTGGTFQFGLAVWEDDAAAWGSGANAFSADTQLQDGADFALRRDQPDGSSSSAMLCRLNDVWGDVWERSGVALSAFRVPGQGNIKVTYWAGYASLPPDLEMACIKSIAKARNSRMYGEALASENYDQYAYQLANLPEVTFGLLSGEVGAMLAPYRRLRQGVAL